MSPNQPEPNVYSLFGVAADMTVPVAPIPFPGAGERHLAYEIHIRNHSAVEMVLERLEVLHDGATLAGWEGADLQAIVAQRRPDVTDNRAIPPGGWAIVYVWVTTDPAASLLTVLRHRLTVDARTVEGKVPVVAGNPIVIGPPLRGAEWLAANGPGNNAVHRRAIVPIGGQAFISQRYAIDWARLGRDGSLFEGDRNNNGSYFGYGVEVLAVADGRVDSVKDGIPENVPGSPRLKEMSEGDTLRAVPMTLETIGGNYVILDLGESRYAFYGHLMPGSLRVEPGDRVRRGVVIGRLGNSGNSTGPHLHFHLSDRNQPLAAEGLPYVIDSWELIRAPDRWERRTNEIPMRDARVRFPRN
jgi:murein DD-endopeptidase MepM/ murein hydrolase activator NlpD